MKGDINKIIKPLIGQGQAFSIMTVREIKRFLGIIELNFNYQLDADSNKTDFLRAWDNSTRTQIVMHNDVAELISQNNDIDTLSLQDKGTYTSASGLKYRKYFIVVYNEQPTSFRL